MSTESPIWAVVPAAGSGRRMGGSIPKQYLRFQDKTVLEHSLDRLFADPRVQGVVLVLAPHDHDWAALDYPAARPVLTAVGGAERCLSVLNGLHRLCEQQGENTLVLVHDAARPLLRSSDLGRLIDAAGSNPDGAILASRVSDTLKQQDGEGRIASTLDRAGLWRALTPQAFPLVRLRGALQRAIEDGVAVTDDASAMEREGFRPLLVAGAPDNLKITGPGDLALAEAIWLHQRDQQDDK